MHFLENGVVDFELAEAELKEASELFGNNLVAGFLFVFQDNAFTDRNVVQTVEIVGLGHHVTVEESVRVDFAEVVAPSAGILFLGKADRGLTDLEFEVLDSGFQSFQGGKVLKEKIAVFKRNLNGLDHQLQGVDVDHRSSGASDGLFEECFELSLDETHALN